MPTWLSNIMEKGQAFGIRLLDPFPLLRLQRIHDQFLMDIFLSHGFSKGALWQLNWCRIFVNAVTLADIVSADGTKIRTEAWQGEDPGWRDFHFPQLSPRRNLDWGLWQQALRQMVTTPRARLLLQTLGGWLQAPNLLDSQAIKWGYSQPEDILVERRGHLWWEWRRTPARANQRHSLGWFAEGTHRTKGRHPESRGFSLEVQSGIAIDRCPPPEGTASSTTIFS